MLHAAKHSSSVQSQCSEGVLIHHLKRWSKEGYVVVSRRRKRAQVGFSTQAVFRQIRLGAKVTLYNERQARRVVLFMDDTRELPFCYELKAMDLCGLRPDVTLDAKQTHLPSHIPRTAQRNWTCDITGQFL